jgi:hypothetical protein
MKVIRLNCQPEDVQVKFRFSHRPSISERLFNFKPQERGFSEAQRDASSSR